MLMDAMVFKSNLILFFTRIKKLDKFQMNIIEELEKFEKDSESLKDLEKEFVVCAFKII